MNNWKNKLIGGGVVLTLIAAFVASLSTATTPKTASQEAKNEQVQVSPQQAVTGISESSTEALLAASPSPISTPIPTPLPSVLKTPSPKTIQKPTPIASVITKPTPVIKPTPASTPVIQAPPPTQSDYPCGSYTNTDGLKVASPCKTESSGNTGVCRDGSFTSAVNHQGACSHHGGVDHWY